MPIELVPLCEANVVLAEPIIVGAGPQGVRIVVEVEEATITGDRISGRMKGRSGADWVTVVGTTGTVDVRLTFETEDSALVFVQYRGRLDLTNGAGSAPVYVAPTFETSAPQYAWLNLVQAVGKGTIDGHHLHYDWFEVR
jgi:hypothetical protein